MKTAESGTGAAASAAAVRAGRRGRRGGGGAAEEVEAKERPLVAEGETAAGAGAGAADESEHVGPESGGREEHQGSSSLLRLQRSSLSSGSSDIPLSSF